jgi:ABC-type multidrug transport system ATPase subunit
LLPSLTALETLEFAAQLRLPDSLSLKDKMNRAFKVLVSLGLKDCAYTIVGSESIKGLSGGEKRRLSIGVQLLTDPSILVIDGIHNL